MRPVQRSDEDRPIGLETSSADQGTSEIRDRIETVLGGIHAFLGATRISEVVFDAFSGKVAEDWASFIEHRELDHLAGTVPTPVLTRPVGYDHGAFP